MKKVNIFDSLGVIKFFIFIITSVLFFSGCASKPKFSGEGDLCGLIIDENNKPVKDFVVRCCNKNLQSEKPVITNESGLFVFNDVPSGNYLLWGEKINYLRIPKTTYKFNDRSKIICLQTKSFKASLLQVEDLMALDQTDEADKLLNDICYESKSYEAQVIQAYKFFITKNEREKKSLIKKMKKSNGPEKYFFKEFAEKLEEVMK